MAYGSAYPVSSDSLATSAPQLRANFSYLETMLNPTFCAEEHLLNFVGEIKMYGGSTTPRGWLICDGSAYSRTNASYAGLYSVIGTSYGVGDGALTFNVPSFCNVFVRGVAVSPGATGGNDSHTNSVGTLAAAVSGSTGSYDSGSGSQGTVGGGGADYSNHTHSVGTLAVGLSGSTGASDNIPKYGTAIYIIKR